MRRFLQILPLCALLLPLAGCQEEINVQSVPYDLVALPPAHDFGVVAIGSLVTGTIVVSNVGGGSATVTGSRLGGSGGGTFSLAEDWAGEIVKNGGTHDFLVDFLPLAEGIYEETLILSLEVASTIHTFEVAIRGRAVADGLRVYPLVVDFGRVDQDDDASDHFWVENQTDSDIPIANWSLSGEDEGFDVQRPEGLDAFPWVVPARATLEIPVSYSADDDSGREAEVHLVDPDGVDYSARVTLRANICEESSNPNWDSDDDGVTSCGGDCDDSNPDSFPGGIEVADLLDNDCNGLVDDNTELYDDDGDGYTETEGDCNDASTDTWPGAEELADGQDNDCDGTVDEGTTADDSDGDGYTVPAGDCDNNNSLVYPGAQELPDGIDNDCDGVIDNGTGTWDDDGDGYCENPLACADPLVGPGDCNDGDPLANPGQTEVINGVDDDCDGIVDNGTDAYDNDGDGYSALGGDCDNDDDTVYPGAPELYDGQDNDCDGIVDEGTDYFDDDGDLVTEANGDCNDNNPDVFPGAAEDRAAANPGEGDGMDNNCNGTVDEGTLSYDDDGDGFSELGGDCNDTNPQISPAEYDPPDAIDVNCDGVP